MYKIQTFKQSLPSFSKAMSASYPIKGPSGHLRHHNTDITGIHPSVRLLRMQALGNGDATAGQRPTVAGRPNFHLRQEKMEQCAVWALSGHSCVTVKSTSLPGPQRGIVTHSVRAETNPMLSERSMAQSLLACMGLPRRKGSTCDRCPSRGQPGMTGGKRRQKRGHEYRNWWDMSRHLMKQRRANMREDIMCLSLQLQFSLGKKL